MIVDEFFLPTQATAEYLYKKHFTRKHIWKVVEAFRISFRGQEFQNLQEKFKLVMGKEFATNAPKKETGKALKTIMEEKSHGSKDGIKKAQQAKHQEGNLTKEQAIKQYHLRCGR